MTIIERKEREKNLLRVKILKAAEELFIKEGYENLSMRKIAAKIDYSPTTIYRFFKNKEEMMKEITASGYAELTEKFVVVKKNLEGDPAGLLKSMIREYVKLYLHRPELFELWSKHGEITMEDDWLYAYMGSEKYKIFYSWFECIGECISMNLFRSNSVHEVFFSIWCAMHGLISLRIHFPGVPWPQEDQHLEDITNMIFEGLMRK